MILLLLALLSGNGAVSHRDGAAAVPDTSTWRARWIWPAGKKLEKNYYAAFRRTFSLSTIPKTAPARITADARYKLWVNGRFVGRGPARSDPAWLYYDRFDLAPYLRNGDNLIAVLVWHPHESFQYVPAPAGLLFEAQVGQQTIASDPHWLARQNDAYRQDLPKMCLQLPAMLEFDARKEQAAWNSAAGFRGEGWQPASELGAAGMPPHVNLIPRDIPHLREKAIPPARIVGQYLIQQDEKTEAMPPWERISKEELRPLRQGITIDPTSENLISLSSERSAVILDMGREMIGFPRFDITAPAGTVVDMGYGELLENGRVNANRADVHYADRYICRDGRQQFEIFTQRAFRYVQIDARLPNPSPLTPHPLVTIHRFEQNYATYPVQYRGSFECSDSTLNEIWKLGRYTVEQCMEDAYTDCPWRERGQWWGDARAEAFTTYYAFGDARLIRKAILQIGQGQHPDGITPGVWPADFNTPLPDFCLIWVMTLEDYVRFTGDLAFAREIYPKVVKALRWFEKYRDLEGLLRDVPNWVFIDWADIDKKGASTALNAYYVGALQAAAQIAARLDKLDESVAWARRAAHQAEDINTRLWDETEGAYIDADGPNHAKSNVISEQANALCVLYGIADEAKRQRIFKRIGQGPANPTIGQSTPATQRPTDPTTRKIVRCGSPYFSFYWLWAMHAAGLHKEAVDYIRSRWKVMLDAGATTAWEVWNPGASLCHGWSSGPTSLLPAWVLGVRPLTDGMRRIVVAPQPAGLQWARGSMPTPRGVVSVSWRLVGSHMRISVTIPKGIATEVILPDNPPRVAYDGNAVLNPRRSSQGAHLLVPPGSHVIEGQD